ncbi:MAG: zinc ABC transporter substrate-binding protein [Treponema sp.]|nr:zinc ABC transporter substrate-binding protein [Treponema sp.]
MKRFLCIVILLSLSVCPLFAEGNKEKAVDNGKLDVVAVNFPAYDFARQIAGDRANLTMLLPPGAESHSFEPTPRDIIKIQNCDVFIYTGGESDVWVDRIFESMDTSNMKIIRMMDAVDVVEEEIVEGMEDDEHEHGEFDPANVKDRPLNDFAGSWASGVLFLKNGSLDSYIAHRAEEEGNSAADVKASLISGWASDYGSLTIAGNTLVIGNRAAAYTYQGYEIVESEHGASVWYTYQIATPSNGFPAYIMLNDHGDGNEEERHEGHEHEGAAHIHLKYGDVSFAALVERADWSPMYFASSASAEEIAESLAGHEHEETAYDEHVWTSPKNAKRIVGAIADVLCAADSANAAFFRRNAEAYSARLDELDRKFQAVVNNAKRTTIVLGDRFPFRYFADAYGLSYFAAFPGCSTETEPSAATIAFLIDKIKAEKIPVVFYIELSNERMADTIAEETGAKKVLLHACHNISKRDFDRGATYMELMTNNVGALRQALQ